MLSDWSFAIGGGVSVPSGWIWLDSACFDHVCPEWFGRDTPMTPISHNPVKAADGHELAVHGARQMRLCLGAEKQPVMIRFVVLSVTRPLLSVPKLVESGFQVHFQQGGGVIAHSTMKGRVTFQRLANMFAVRITLDKAEVAAIAEEVRER